MKRTRTAFADLHLLDGSFDGMLAKPKLSIPKRPRPSPIAVDNPPASPPVSSSERTFMPAQPHTLRPINHAISSGPGTCENQKSMMVHDNDEVNDVFVSTEELAVRLSDIEVSCGNTSPSFSASRLATFSLVLALSPATVERFDEDAAEQVVFAPSFPSPGRHQPFPSHLNGVLKEKADNLNLQCFV